MVHTYNQHMLAEVGKLESRKSRNHKPSIAFFIDMSPFSENNQPIACIIFGYSWYYKSPLICSPWGSSFVFAFSSQITSCSPCRFYFSKWLGFKCLIPCHIKYWSYFKIHSVKFLTLNWNHNYRCNNRFIKYNWLRFSVLCDWDKL